jgi:hypothetical protein
MLDILKRSLVSLFSAAVIAYTVWMSMNGAVIVQAEYIGMNLIATLAVIVIAFYMMVVYGVYPLYHPMQKRILLVIWLACIIFGHMILLNDVEKAIYASDIVRLFGVLIIWFGATGILTKTKAIEGKKREKNLEIIEA